MTTFLLRSIKGEGMNKSGIGNVDQIGRINSTSFCLTFLCLLLIGPGYLFAGSGVYGTKAAGMGTAFLAVSDDPSAIAFNPAGLVLLEGTQLYSGFTAITASTGFKGSGYSEHTDFQMFFPPFLYAVSDLGTRDLRFGLGLYSPFGIGGRKWPTDGVIKYLSVESSTATGAVNPTVAYRLSPKLSIAAGVSYMVARIEAESRINQSAVGGQDGTLEMTAQGGGWGYNVAILFTPSPQWSLGIAYRSRIKIDYDGKVVLSNIAPALQPVFGGDRFRSGITTTCRFPDQLGLGIAYRPSGKWTISADAERLGWSSFRKSRINIERQVLPAGFTDRETRLDWKDTLTFKIGAEYKYNENLVLRGGYGYFPSYVPDLSLEPSNPDSDQHNISIGLGYRLRSWQFDFSYNLGLWEDRRVENRILSGKYENIVHYFSFGLNKTF
jgi:long-chain fatty acid transport protein